MSVKTKACSLLVCFSMVVSSLAVPVLADSTVNAGNAAAEAGNTAADVGDAAGDACCHPLSGR